MKGTVAYSKTLGMCVCASISGVRRQNIMIAKVVNNNSIAMVLIFSPFLLGYVGDFMEIWLMGASHWGFQTHPRAWFCVVSAYLRLHEKRSLEAKRHPSVAIAWQFSFCCHTRASTAPQLVAFGTHKVSTSVATPSIACQLRSSMKSHATMKSWVSCLCCCHKL